MFTSPWQKPFRGMQINKAHPLARGLVGCWVINEATGDKVFDLSGNDNTGTNNGADWVADGLDFNGTSDYVTFGDKPEFALPEYSWVTGVKGDSAPSTASVGPVLWNADQQFQFTWSHTNAAFVQCAVHKSGATNWYKAQIATTMYADTYYNVSGTYDSSNIKIYLDGGLEDTEAAGTPNEVALPFNIGRMTTDNYFAGKVYYVYVYNRALSAEEVVWLNREPYAIFEQPISPASLYYEAAPPVGAIMNQFQGANIGADLFNGALL